MHIVPTQELLGTKKWYLMIMMPWSSFLALSLRGWDPLKVLMDPCKEREGSHPPPSPI